jgi:hypothetical protein
MWPAQNARGDLSYPRSARIHYRYDRPRPVSEIPNETTRIKIAIHNANLDTDGFINALAQFITHQPWMDPGRSACHAFEPPTPGDDNHP